MSVDRPPGEQESGSDGPGDVLQLPVVPCATDIALDELEIVYAFIYARVGKDP